MFTETLETWTNQWWLYFSMLLLCIIFFFGLLLSLSVKKINKNKNTQTKRFQLNPESHYTRQLHRMTRRNNPLHALHNEFQLLSGQRFVVPTCKTKCCKNSFTNVRLQLQTSFTYVQTKLPQPMDITYSQWRINHLRHTFVISIQPWFCQTQFCTIMQNS